MPRRPRALFCSIVVRAGWSRLVLQLPHGVGAVGALAFVLEDFELRLDRLARPVVIVDVGVGSLQMGVERDGFDLAAGGGDLFPFDLVAAPKFWGGVHVF